MHRTDDSPNSHEDAPDEQGDVLVQLDEDPDLVVRVQETSPLEEPRQGLRRAKVENQRQQ